MVIKDEFDQWLDALKQYDIGNSKTQEVLIVVLSTAKGPMSAEEIWEETQRIRPETGRATVYRFIDKLTSLGLLRRVHGYRNCSTYIPSIMPHQALLVCTQCGKVSELESDLEDQIVAAVEAITSDLETYHIKAFHLQLLGTCIDCESNYP